MSRPRRLNASRSQYFDRCRQHNYHLITLIKISVISDDSLVSRGENNRRNFLFRVPQFHHRLFRETTIRYTSFAMVETLINYLLNSSYYSFIFCFQEIKFFGNTLKVLHSFGASLNQLRFCVRDYWIRLLWSAAKRSDIKEVMEASPGELNAFQLMSRHLVFAKMPKDHAYTFVKYLFIHYCTRCFIE